MIVALTAPLLVSLVMCLTVGRVVDPKAPAGRGRCWTLVATAVGIAGLTVAALAVLAWYAVGGLPAVAREGHWPAAQWWPHAPVPAPVAWIALIGLAAAGANAARCTIGAIRNLHRAHRQVGGAVGGVMVVIDQSEIAAFAMPRFMRRAGRIVVTTALLDALVDPRQRSTMVEHELAHLRHHHFALGLVVRVSTAVNPLLASLRLRVDHELERCADREAAARSSGPIMATTLATVALGQRSSTPRGTLAINGSSVADRIDALLHPSPRQRLLPLWSIGLVAIAAAGLIIGCHGTERFFEHLTATQSTR